MRKTFKPGQAVECQRDPGSAWESASYDGECDMPSRCRHHWVRIPESSAPIYVDLVSGIRYDDPDIEGRRRRVTKIIVPSARIRAVEDRRLS